MTTAQLSFVAPPQLAIALGAVTPDPGGAGAAGVMVWSTTTNNYVKWTGTSWAAVDTTGGGSVTINTATITVPYSSNEYVATVSDANVTAASKIMLVDGMYVDTDTNVPEDVRMSISGVPGTGSFKVRLSGTDNQNIGGPFKISYLLG